MTATVLPADGMIAVLSDAIASKRITVAALETAAKETAADLAHLREVRAIHLARAAGVEVGAYHLMEMAYGGVRQAAVVLSIEPRRVGGVDAGNSDWTAKVAFDSLHNGEPHTRDYDPTDWSSCCYGAVHASVDLVQRFAGIQQAIEKRKGRTT